MVIGRKYQERCKQAFGTIGASPLSITGMLIILFFLVIAIFAPYIAPYPQDATGYTHSLKEKLQPPSPRHLAGTDDLGRDVLSRVIYGTRLSFGLGVAVVIATAIIGIPLGLVAGYFGGKTDEVIMRIGDIFLAIPFLLLAIAIVLAAGHGLGKLVFAIALPWWPWYTRVVRGEVIQLKEMSFIEAASAVGASNMRIIFCHILPNVLNIVIVQASIQIGRAILAVGSMGFLGLGARPPQTEWGLMVSIGRQFMPTWWWIACFPGAAIFLISLGFNLFGDGLRDILDPRGLTQER
jgi:peptide/nickel transport system permease protein